MLNIKLGYYKNLVDGAKVMIPYWFTRGNEIYLNSKNNSVEIDETKFSKEVLIQIYNGSLYGDITIDNEESLMKAIDLAKPEEAKLQTTNVVNSMEDLEKREREEKEKKLEKEAKELTSKGYNEVRVKVGSSALNEDGTLKDGIVDIKLLKKALELEEASTDPRKGILKILKGRLEAINKSNGVMISEKEEKIEIKQEDFE